MAIERLPLPLAISPDYPHVEVWSESGISNVRLREKIEEANKPINRQDAFNDVSGILNCDSLDVVPKLKNKSRPGAQQLGFEDDTNTVIRVTNITELMSLREHQREGVQKSLYNRFHLGDGWDETRINTEKANIKYARLVKFDVNGDISPGQLCAFYGYLKTVLASHKSHKNGYCVVSALPKEDSDPEGNRKITAPLFNGASTQPSLPSTRDNISTASDFGRQPKASELPRRPVGGGQHTRFADSNQGVQIGVNYGTISGTHFDNKRDNQHIENVHATDHSTALVGKIKNQDPNLRPSGNEEAPTFPGKSKGPLSSGSSQSHADPLRRMGWSATYGSMVMHRWDGRTWVPAPDESALPGGYDTRPNAKAEDASLAYLDKKAELEKAKTEYRSLQDKANKINGLFHRTDKKTAEAKSEKARKHYEKKKDELEKAKEKAKDACQPVLERHRVFKTKVERIRADIQRDGSDAARNRILADIQRLKDEAHRESVTAVKEDMNTLLAAINPILAARGMVAIDRVPADIRRSQVTTPASERSRVFRAKADRVIADIARPGFEVARNRILADIQRLNDETRREQDPGLKADMNTLLAGLNRLMTATDRKVDEARRIGNTGVKAATDHVPEDGGRSQRTVPVSESSPSRKIDRPRLNTLNTLLMRRGDGSSGKNALNTILYAFGISPMHDVEFPDKIPYGQHCEHYLGPSVAELIKVSGGKGLEARPHGPEKIRESGIDDTKGFMLLKPMDPQKSHYVAMVRSEVTGRFHVSDSLDQDSAKKERYSPSANDALMEYQRQHNVTVDGALTFHQQSQ